MIDFKGRLGVWVLFCGLECMGRYRGFLSRKVEICIKVILVIVFDKWW